MLSETEADARAWAALAELPPEAIAQACAGLDWEEIRRRGEELAAKFDVPVTVAVLCDTLYRGAAP